MDLPARCVFCSTSFQNRLSNVGDGAQKIILFTSEPQLRLIERTNVLASDGTFVCAPSAAKQVYVVVSLASSFWGLLGESLAAIRTVSIRADGCTLSSGGACTPAWARRESVRNGAETLEAACEHRNNRILHYTL